MIAISIPNFFLGLMAIYVFSLRLGWLPSGGLRTLGEDPSMIDSLEHLLMPAGVLSAVLIGPYVRYTRQSMLDVLKPKAELVVDRDQRHAHRRVNVCDLRLL